MRRVEQSLSWSASVSLSHSTTGDDHGSPFYETATSTHELANSLEKAASIVSERSKSPSGFSSECIHVTVSSPQLLDLTVIDLPGIIRTTTAGQHKSVIKEVDDLLEEYLRQPDTIILALIPANQDISTVDILERACRFDPKGERTIGVLTKPDLIDRLYTFIYHTNMLNNKCTLFSGARRRTS
jgi:interferon-induced GTP-binding protein Mx1